MKQPQWYIGIVNGMGPCAFWGSVDEDGIWSLKNVTSFIQNPQTGQMGIKKWPLMVEGFFPEEIRVTSSHMVWVEGAGDKLIEGLTKIWDSGSNGRIVTAERKLPDAFRR